MTHWPNSLLFLSSSLYTHISFAYIVYITNFKIKRNSPLISTFMGFYFWFYAKYGITFTIQFSCLKWQWKWYCLKAQPCIITSLYFIYSWKFHQIYKKLFYKHTLKNKPYYTAWKYISHNSPLLNFIQGKKIGGILSLFVIEQIFKELWTIAIV